MKNTFFIFLFAIFVYFCLPIGTAYVWAGLLKFDKTTVTPNNGDTFQIGVVVDAGSDQITSTDAYISYDATLLQAQSVAGGSFFPTVSNNITSGKVYVAGLVDDPATYKTASGTLATITFKALKSGSGTLGFDCQSGVSGSSKIIKNDTNATNVIQCAQNGSASFTVGSGGSSSSSSSSGSSGGTGTNPTSSTLPKSGVIENVAQYAVPGGILLLIGGALRLIL